MIATVIDRAADAAACQPAACRIGLLGLGNVGSAFARLTREAAARLSGRGVVPLVATSLVRHADRERPAARFVNSITDNHDVFFSEPVDIVVEAIGGVEPAFTLVRRALERGVPVVTANKSLMAAHGEELARLARRRGTALRYEAACIAGVPFLGTFERRALVSRASGVTAILNGTSNHIVSAMTKGGSFGSALEEAQRLGYAEPDPSMDVSGVDAAEKLTILIRLFARLLVDPAAIPRDHLASLDPEDIAAAGAFGGAIRPVARAFWDGDAVRAHVGPAFLSGTHPLVNVAGVTNGVVIDAEGGAQCYIGPGAGPDVTAATLLDDVAEIVRERHVVVPAAEPVRQAASIVCPDSAWLLRLTANVLHEDIADLLGAYGVWCTRLTRRGTRLYALTCRVGAERIHSAVDALSAATGLTATAFPALGDEAQ